MSRPSGAISDNYGGDPRHAQPERFEQTFHTYNQGKDPDTVVHVFVKNRPRTTAGSDQNTTFISNLLASQRYLEGGDLEDHASSPYLGYRAGIAANEAFEDPSDNTFFLNLMPQQADLADIVLPAVDIHILPHGNNRWIFDYTLTFTFDDVDQSTFTYSSKDDGGLPGIILDQDNRDYSGICAENPLALPSAPDKPVTNAVLRNVTLEFITHDDNKNSSTRLDIEILNRLSADSFQQIAAKVDAFPGQGFDDDRSVIKTISWPGDGGDLNEVSLAAMVLPLVNISIEAGQDRWIFDYRFLSADPPYLGTRYAAANDLSSVVGTQLRQSQFLPFIRYNAQYRASQMMLGIKDANPAPGAQVWQLPTGGSAAQDFSFEDAGNGFFYIRSHVSGLYLTLHADPPTPAAGDESGAAAGAPGPIPVPQPIPPVVIQDVKFVPGTTSANTGSGGAVVPLPEVARQQWSFVPVGSGAGPDLFAVQSRAAAGMVLQPTDPTKPGPVVLRTVPLGTPLATFAWKVTSPALTSWVIHNG